MPIILGRFLSGKLFKHLFIMLYVALICFAAYETKMAFSLLTEMSHQFEIVYIVYGLVIFLLLTRNFVNSVYNSRNYKKLMGFLSGFLIYYLLLFLCFEFISIIFSLPDRVKAIGMVTILAAAMVIVLLGYLHTKSIVVQHYGVQTDSIESHYRIVLISDIHLGLNCNIK